MNSQSINEHKLILVTGSNKGIGYGMVKELLRKNDKYDLILTSRNEELGKEAVSKILDELKDEKSNIEKRLFYHQLDITSKDSMNNICAWIKEKFGKIDILVNNAGVASKGTTFDLETCNQTFDTNVYGTINFTEKMIEEDLIRQGGKIIIMGSNAGLLTRLTKEDLKKAFTDEDLTNEKLFALADGYKKSIENDSVEKDGWIKNTYCISKMIDNSYPKVLAKRKDIQARNIGVYSCHPGWVKTDMAGPKAPLSIEEGVVTPNYVVELPDGIVPELQGKYFDQCKAVPFEY